MERRRFYLVQETSTNLYNVAVVNSTAFRFQNDQWFFASPKPRRRRDFAVAGNSLILLLYEIDV